MSGIAGIILQNGKPVNRQLLESMTLKMADRGPDGHQVWSKGHIGLGHTLLHTSVDTPATGQPRSLDGRIWITADARVDGRDSLKAKLGDNDRYLRGHPADVDLILAAYRKWGRNCVHHLLGDFAFALWDDERNELFCARDPLGIKPFYYCRIPDGFIFGNTLESLRQHPHISGTLNEQTVADYLLYGFSIHPDISLFRDIRKLPPGHTMTVNANADLRIRRYWRLPVEKIRRFKQAGDCFEQFNTVFQKAVGDRLRTDRVGVLMSGGLDSTSVAAQTQSCLAAQFEHFDLQAFTLVYEWLIKDQEANYARQAADTIGIPVHLLKLDDIGPHEIFGAVNAMKTLLESSFAGPAGSTSTGTLLSRNACRVGICGYGGDELFHPGFTDLKAWLRNKHWPALALEAFKYWGTHGRLPAIGLRTYLRKRLAKKRRSGSPPYPPWLNKRFERRLNLPQQWSSFYGPKQPADTIRSAAVHGLQHPLWYNLFEAFDPGMTGIPVELRFPFLDLRLISFCLQLPPIPWCVDKYLLRRSSRNRLPETVSLRPKTPLAGFPDFEHLVRATDADKIFSYILEEFKPFIDMKTYRNIARQPQRLRPGEQTLITHPLRLARWLHQQAERAGKDKGRSSWQNPETSRSRKSPTIPPNCANTAISTA
jgi:asparagine synthase (glutamine-hydrolysing)